jgi:hypothetical protein
LRATVACGAGVAGVSVRGAGLAVRGIAVGGSVGARDGMAVLAVGELVAGA